MILSTLKLANMNEDYGYVRQPDSVRRERLISHNGFIPYSEALTEEEQLSKLLLQSELEYETQIALAESELEEGRRRARDERTKHFTTLKLKFHQFKRLDKNNQAFYQTILNYFESYESGHTMRVEINSDLYDKFRRTLDNMRINPEELRRALAFIVSK